MTTLDQISKPESQHQASDQRTRKPNFQNVRASGSIAPLPLEVLQGLSFTWNFGRVLFRVVRFEPKILVARGTEVRPELGPSFVEGNRVPEIPDTAVGESKWEAVWNEADGVDCVPDRWL